MCKIALSMFETVFMASIRERCSVVKSDASAVWRRMDRCEGRAFVKAALLAASQRSDTPFARSASATGGNKVSSAAESTRSVSTLLHAAG